MGLHCPQACVLWESILPGLVQLLGQLHHAIEQGWNQAAAEMLPVPAQPMMAAPQAQEQQAVSLALVMALLPCCSMQTEPLPFLMLDLLQGFHHKQLWRGGSFQGRMGQTGAVQG